MTDIRSVKDNYHALEQIRGHFVFICLFHDVSHLKFNRCFGFLRDKKSSIVSIHQSWSDARTLYDWSVYRQRGGEVETELGGLITVNKEWHDPLHYKNRRCKTEQFTNKYYMIDSVKGFAPHSLNPALVAVAKIHWRRNLLVRKQSPAHFLCPVGKHCYLLPSNWFFFHFL